MVVMYVHVYFGGEKLKLTFGEKKGFVCVIGIFDKYLIFLYKDETYLLCII